MFIGYSEETLWSNILRQVEEIKSEYAWLAQYQRDKNVDCVEDCARNIMDSCKAILENIENLKGETL